MTSNQSASITRRIASILLWAGLVALTVFGAETWLWSRYVTRIFTVAQSGPPHKPTEAEARAAHDAGFQWWLAHQYGPQDVPANREKAFLSYLDPASFKEFRRYARLRTPDQYRTDMQTTARWIEQYRCSMTPEERADLRATLNSDSGRAMLHAATAEFQSMDVSFRGSVKPVVAELMITLADLQKL